MIRLPLTLFFALTVGLSACNDDIATKSPTEIERPSDTIVTCQAEVLQYLIGATEADIRVADLPAGTRVIMFGMAVTKDYRPERTNIQFGRSNTVERITCG